MSGYVWLPITSFKVMNTPVSLPLARLNEQIKTHHLRDGSLLVTSDRSSSLAWILPPDNTFCACAASRGHHPAETHAHTQIKIQPVNIQLTTFHHSFRTCLYLIFSLTHTRLKVSGGLAGCWWMDVKGVILDKQSLGPHAATSWKICLLHQQMREIVWRSLTSSLSLTLSLSLHGTYIFCHSLCTESEK